MHRNDNIILRTKLHRPAIGEDLIARPHLLELLQKGRDKPVSLVCAPAGYGKSILVSRWLEECQFPHTWLSLDEEHNNLRIFFLYLQAVC